MSPLMDLFDREKGILSKADKRLLKADQEAEERGADRAAASYVKLLDYLEENRGSVVRLRGDLSRVYTKLGERLERAGRDEPAAVALEARIGDELALAAEDRVEHRVGDLVADLVGVSFSDALRCEKEIFSDSHCASSRWAKSV
mgnify:CR=1 FL=1